MRLFIAVVMAVAVAGCEFKEPINDDIEGFWKLERFETNADGRMHECTRLYYSITRYVVEVSEKQGPNGYGTFIGRFGYKDGETKVVMKDFKQRANTSDNGVSATVDDLKPFGIDSLETTLMLLLPTATTLFFALITQRFS